MGVFSRLWASILAMGLAWGGAIPGARGQGFTVSAPEDEKAGTAAESAVLHDFALDTPTKMHEVKTAFKRVSQETFAGGGGVESLWKSEVGNIQVKCRTEKTAWGYSFETTITNGITHRIGAIDVRLPQIHAPADWGNRLHSPARGGRDVVWPQDDWQKGMGNTYLWPNAAFSPVLTLWNQTSGQTLGITFFNRSLTPSIVYWFSGPGGGQQHLNPFVRYHPELPPGQAITFTMEYRMMEGGPAAHQKDYRTRFLAPFMEELGIPEAVGGLDPAPIAMTAGLERGKLRETLVAAVAAGASTYIQWSPPDGQSEYFNPYPGHMPWFEELAVARQVRGIKQIGVLINPFITPPLRADNYALRPRQASQRMTNLRLNLASPENREYLVRTRDELVKRGVSIAFWDTGGGPDRVNGHEWLKLLANWKQGGVAIMPETSCDVAAWTTGLWMEYPYSWGEYDLCKTICPQASLAAHTNQPDVRNGIDWKQDAMKKGVRPIVDVMELRRMPR